MKFTERPANAQSLGLAPAIRPPQTSSGQLRGPFPPSTTRTSSVTRTHVGLKRLNLQVSPPSPCRVRSPQQARRRAMWDMENEHTPTAWIALPPCRCQPQLAEFAAEASDSCRSMQEFSFSLNSQRSCVIYKEAQSRYPYPHKSYAAERPVSVLVYDMVSGTNGSSRCFHRAARKQGADQGVRQTSIQVHPHPCPVVSCRILSRIMP
jgi:hypothetical protein